jgi:hypothetical protein
MWARVVRPRDAQVHVGLMIFKDVSAVKQAKGSASAWPELNNGWRVKKGLGRYWCQANPHLHAVLIVALRW